MKEKDVDKEEMEEDEVGKTRTIAKFKKQETGASTTFTFFLLILTSSLTLKKHLKIYRIKTIA